MSDSLLDISEGFGPSQTVGFSTTKKALVQIHVCQP